MARPRGRRRWRADRRERRMAWLAGAGVVAVLATAIPVAVQRLPAGGSAPAATRTAPAAAPAVEQVAVVPDVPDVPAVPGPTAPPVPVAPSPSDGAAADRPADPAVATTPVQPVRAAVVVDLGPAPDGEVPAQVAEAEATARDVLAGLDGVRAVAAITVGAVRLGGVPAQVAAVDVEAFRPLTPEATANHPPLWQRIAAGDVAVTHEWGTSHAVVLGTRLPVTAPGGAASDPAAAQATTATQAAPGGTTAEADGTTPAALRAGALATNGTPPIADAIVAEHALAALGGLADASRRLLVGLAAEASPTAVAEALVEAGLDAEEVPDPRAPRDDVVLPTGAITPENVWDHLAVCESSGNWQINTGNGYYGGLQFLPESWALVGGTGLPHQHTREEQIHRAALLWQLQGWEAWPQCARRLGLIVDPPPDSGGAPPEGQQ